MENGLSQLISNQVNTYHYYTPSFDVSAIGRVGYVVSADGLYRVEQTPVATFWSRLEEFKQHLPGLMAATPGPRLRIPRIPFYLLQQVFSFYKDIEKIYGTEASALFFYNHNQIDLPSRLDSGETIHGLTEEGDFILYVPKQTNTAVRSIFAKDPFVDWLREHTTPVCETHSHHHMEAYFSKVDDDNEKSTQFYGVWGKVDTDSPQFVLRYCSGSTKELIQPFQLFDWPTVTVHEKRFINGFQYTGEIELYTENEEIIPYEGPIPHLAYPGEWQDRQFKLDSKEPTHLYYQTPEEWS